jgi:hypothetical protein
MIPRRIGDGTAMQSLMRLSEIDKAQAEAARSYLG